MRRAALVVAVLLGAADKPADPPGVVGMSTQQQQTVKLQTARAERRAITEPVVVPGIVAFDQSRVADVRTLAPSLVTRLLVRPGDAVRAGQALAELEVPTLVDAQNSLATALASQKQSEVAVSVARDALRRAEILSRDGSLSRAEAQQRRLLLAQAQAQADAGRANVAAMQMRVDRLHPAAGPGTATLTTPIDGVVVTVGLAPGGLVDTASPAVTVADLSVMWVQAQVPEASAALVAVGDAARVRLLPGGRAWDGRIVALGAAVDTSARTLPARIQLANDDGALRAGLAAEVTVTSERGRDNVVVPAAAVQMVAGKRVAFVPAGGETFQSRELTLGVEQPDWVEVRSGLKEGEQVVTQGSFELKALLQQAMLGGSG